MLVINSCENEVIVIELL